MCGEIRKSPDATTAVQWAIAYAKSFEDAGDGKYQRYDDGLPDDSLRRRIAGEFITEHVPATQRPEATVLLAKMPDPLDTEVDYWSTVVDQEIGFPEYMSILGTSAHDTFNNYKPRQEHDELAQAERRYDE